MILTVATRIVPRLGVPVRLALSLGAKWWYLGKVEIWKVLMSTSLRLVNLWLRLFERFSIAVVVVRQVNFVLGVSVGHQTRRRQYSGVLISW